ncbi:hypothetical protein [Arsenicibacter rosenii]|uniref:Uncharacterized protein n=1 Tax=Arsenicibacter rosenii TaxID=1750698 RepID=A0A1S2VBI5_9BACT|nr:hypothetical protein [Arsenicibacter rosenii]OIN55675.1 hypothetical protein BLX24_28770 [Arsenicibacter rosenii]
MIDIRIEGQSLDLASDTAFSLETFNPLFDMSEIQGARVYPFTVPSTPRNRRILGYFYDPKVGYDNRRYRAEKYLFGEQIERGFIRIIEVNEKGFSLYYTHNLGEIFFDLQKTRLNEMLDLGSEPVPASPAVNPSLTDAGTKYFFPSVINPSFYGNNTTVSYSGTVNNWNGSAFLPNARVPMIYLKWLFNRFAQLANFRFAGDFFTDPTLSRLLLFNQYALDGATTLSYTNHLPAMTMPELILNLRLLFNLYLEFDPWNRILTADFAKDIISTQHVIDWTNKAFPNHTKIPELINRLDLGYEIDSNDLLMNPVPADFDKYITPETSLNQGGSILPVRSRFSTLNTDATSGLAKIQQAGISVNNKDSSQSGSPKLLFWNGVISGVPTATNQYGNVRLAWHGANNLVDRYWSNYEAMRESTFLVKKIVHLTPGDLARFSFRQKVHIRGVNYLVGSIKASIIMDRQTVLCEVELYKV